jgi:hypothetical protein
MEHKPTGSFSETTDDQPDLIRRVIDTMGVETCHAEDVPAARTEYTPPLPEPVDFERLATHALSQDLFTPDQVAIRANAAAPRSRRYRLPETLLERPYENGPMSISRFGIDVPEAIMAAKRKNLAKANRLLLPTETLMAYFHERCTAPDVFASDGILLARGNYRPQLSEQDCNPNEALSFTLEGRGTHQRQLFTKTEVRAGNALAVEQPELVMSIVGYAGLIQDYLGNLGHTFARLSRLPEYTVSNQDLHNYDKFTEEWNTPNFTELLMPALAMFLELAQRDQPETNDTPRITPALFQQAIAFLIDNGAFRNFFTVPAAVAENDKERTNHFLCPAIGAVRDQLLNGKVLYQLYQVANSRLQAGERSAVKLCDNVVATARWQLGQDERHKAYEQERAAEKARTVIPIDTTDKDLPTIMKDAVSAALLGRKPATFTQNGKEYTMGSKHIENTLRARNQPPLEDSIHLDNIALRSGGASFGGTLGDAVGEALRHNRSVYFRFNFVDYRVDPEKARALLNLD